MKNKKQNTSLAHRFRKHNEFQVGQAHGNTLGHQQ